MRFEVRVDRTRIRERSRSARYALLRFRAPPAPEGQGRQAANVAFALDRSWSMRGGKFELVKEAVERAIGRLGPRDRFAVVLFHKRAKLLVKSTQASDEAKARAVVDLQKAEIRTGTDLAAGWMAGCEQVAQHPDPERIARCILLTDGEANRGITDRAELSHHAAQLRGRGVSTSTMGVGERFDERLLEALADAGGGHFRFLESVDRVGQVMADELEEMLSVSVRDAAVAVTAPEGVVVESLDGLPVSASGGQLRVSLGDLVGDQVVSLVLQLRFPRGESGHSASVGFRLVDRGELLSGEAQRSWTWADHAANDHQDRDGEVDRAVARAFAERARAEALALNASGDLRGGPARLRATARRIQSYAGRDPELNGLVQALEAEAEDYRAPLEPMERRERHYGGYRQRRGRDARGRAQRRPQVPDLKEILSSLRLGAEEVHQNLTMFPLTNGGTRLPDYQTFAEASTAGTVRVEEVSEGGSVPELRVVNEGERPVLLLDGEELIGAKQNRIVNLTILCPARHTLVVPVSCVEAGRWSHSRPDFMDSRQALFAEARARKTRDVNAALRERGERRTDQQAVWADIETKARHLKTSSRTSAMSDMYEQQAGVIEGYETAFSAAEGQVGALFAINGRAVGLDLFDSQKALEAFLPKLVRSYALDALTHAASTPLKASRSDALDLMATVARTPAGTFPAVGLGVDVRLESETVAGAALAVDGRLVHLSAFRHAADATA